jgi:hypothetical protein
MAPIAEFAHVFLFRCSSCHGALTSMCFTAESNLEMADEQVFRLTCDCRWTGELTGFMAVRHWVQAWELIGAQQTGDSPRSGQAAA